METGEMVIGEHEMAFVVSDPEDLAEARERTCQQARHAGVAADRMGDVAMAVTEAAANVLVHSRAPAVIRCHATDEGFICEVTDPGLPLPGVDIAWRDGVLELTAGLGLTVMRGASDRLDILPHGHGTKVRMVFERTVRPDRERGQIA